MSSVTVDPASAPEGINDLKPLKPMLKSLDPAAFKKAPVETVELKTWDIQDAPEGDQR